MISEEEIDEAIKRIALSDDGRLLYLRLQRVLLSLSPAIKSGALRHHEGRRSLAKDLKALMDSALADLETARGNAGRQPGLDQPVIIAPRRAVVPGRRGPGERRLDRDDTEPPGRSG